MPINPGNRNTLIGGFAGSVTTGYENTGVGVYALYSNTSGTNNTAIGKSAGYNITTGINNVTLGANAGNRITTGQRNICIGYGVGPTTNDATDGYKLYIDTMGDSNGTGSNSLIYGDQSGSNQDLTLNADVVISNNTTNSSGNLTVEGGLTVEGSLSLNELSGSITASSLTLEDINIDVNPSVGRTSFDYNLFFTNNSQNVSFTGLEYNTFFGTYGGHLDITNGARGNCLWLS